MNRNPYAAPTTAVADLPIDPGPKPRVVVRAVQMMWVSTGLGILWALGKVSTFFSRPIPLAGIVAALVTLTLLFALNIWLIGQISQGRRWARNFFGIVAILGVINYCLQLEKLRHLGVSDQAVTGVQTVLQLVITGLLFSGPARAWFRRPTAAASAVVPVASVE
jgi:putative effector of murein hydrolase LrgA (UPF0299 family)